VCLCVCVTSSSAVWPRARPWEAAEWHQRTNCTHNNVRFHVNGRPLWPRLLGISPSPPISAQHHHHFQGGCSITSLDLHANCNLSVPHWLPYSFPLCLFLCPSVSISLHLPFHPPLFPSLPVCFSLSLPLSPSVLLVMAVFLGRCRGPMVVWSQWHCTFSPISLSSSLPFLSLTVYSWPMTLRPQQFKGVALPRRYANCSSISPSLHHCIWMCDWWVEFVCVLFSSSASDHTISFVYLCKSAFVCAPFCLSVRSGCNYVYLCLWVSLITPASLDLGKSGMVASVPQKVLCN